MKVALIVVLMLCLLLVMIGVGLWFIPEEQFPVILKLIFSTLSIGGGVVYGALTLEMLFDEF